MNYLLKSRPKRKKSKVWLATLSVLVLLTSLEIFGFHFFSAFFHGIGKPLWQGESGISSSLGTFSAYFKEKAKLKRENEDLKSSLQAIQSELLSFNLLKEENILLKAELGRNPSQNQLLARILRGPGIVGYDTFILDAGEKEGVTLNDPVTAKTGIRVGFIEEVYPHTSKAKLFSSPGQESEVEISSNHFLVKALGVGNGSFKVEIPKSVEVATGTIITAPGIENDIIGIVEAAEESPTEAYQSVYFRYPLNIHEIDSVFIRRQE